MTGELSAVMAAVQAIPADAPDVPDGVLVPRMEQLVQLRAMLDAVLAEHVSAFDARAAASHDGQTSTHAWLRARLRLGEQASQVLQVARQRDRLPQVAKALTGGEISLEHAAAIARLARQLSTGPAAGELGDYEPILVDLARQAPPAALRVACAHVRQLLDVDTDEQESDRAHRRRHLTAGRTINGMVHLQGLLDAASGDVVLTALQGAMPVPAEHEERTAPQRRADGLVDICAGWLSAGHAPTAGGVRPHVQVTVSLQTLRSAPQYTHRPPADHQQRTGQPPHLPAVFGYQPSPAPGQVPVLADGTPVTPSQARKIACDAGVIPVVLGSDGEILDLGRQARLATVALRRALHLRDGGCRFPGCDRPPHWSDVHHLMHWADGGATNMDNCVLLCAFHHSLAHQGWRLEGEPGSAIRFHRPDGTRLHLTSSSNGNATSGINGNATGGINGTMDSKRTRGPTSSGDT